MTKDVNIHFLPDTLEFKPYSEMTHSSVNNSSIVLDLASEIEHTHWQDEPELSRSVHVILALCSAVFGIASVLGNLSVMIVLKQFRSMRTYSNLLVLNLTIADLLLSLGNIPPFIISSFYDQWVFGVLGCKLYAFTGSIFSFGSINTLAAIAVDRCLVIVKVLPTSWRITGKSFFLLLAFIWANSLFWACTPFFGFGNYILEGTNTSCTFDFFTRTANNRGYVISIFTFHFILPLIVIMASYLLIYWRVKKNNWEFSQAAKVHGEQHIPLSVTKRNNKLIGETKTAKVALVVILLFVISWTPYACVALIGTFGDRAIISRLGAGIPCIFAKISTVLNPVIYALLHPKFRSKLVICRTCNKTAVDRYQLTNCRQSRLSTPPVSS